MKEYELRRNSREINWKNRNEIHIGCTLRQADQEPEVLRSFETKEAALHVLKNYKSSIDTISDEAGPYFSVIEYYIEEAEYDQDGEWIGGGDILEFAEFPDTYDLDKKSKRR